MKLKHLAFALACLPMGMNAATITAAGAVMDITPPGFGVGTDVTDMDAVAAGSGLTIDGHYLFNSVPEGTNIAGQPWALNAVDSLPAYITSLDGSASASSGGWANYDDVTIGGNTYNSGGLVQSPGAGVEVPLLTFDLAGALPVGGVTLAVLVDNSDNAVWDIDGLRLSGGGGDAAYPSGAATFNRNGASDIFLFNIAGGVAGETYTLHGVQPPGTGGALIGGIAFVSEAIPEPSTGLLALAGLGLAFRRRRK